MSAPDTGVIGKKGDTTFKLFVKTHRTHSDDFMLRPVGEQLRVWTARCPCGDYLVVKVDDDLAQIPDIPGEVFGRVS